MKNIGIIGCGTMGGGIAQVASEAGFGVTVLEIKEKFLTSGMKKIDKFLSKSVEKEKITAQQKEDILKRIKGTLDINDLAQCDLIVEAAVEDLDLKRELFQKLDALCKENAVLTTNTSSLTVIEIAEATKRQDKVVGLHFFNPVPLMPLVEVVKTIKTSDEAFKTAWEFIEKIKKIPIAAKDNTGFIVNLLLIPFLLDAIRVLQEGIASVEDIDKGMKFGCGHPMGPLALLDLIGLDVIFKVATIMYNEYKEKKYAPPPLLKQMVLGGYFGVKTGRGFYEYGGDEPKPMDF